MTVVRFPAAVILEIREVKPPVYGPTAGTCRHCPTVECVPPSPPSATGDRYTLVRTPRYYRASEGLPYLDKLVFRIGSRDAIPKDLQAGTITSAWLLDYNKEYQRLTNYILTPTLTSNEFEGLFFNFHNRSEEHTSEL